MHNSTYLFVLSSSWAASEAADDRGWRSTEPSWSEDGSRLKWVGESGQLRPAEMEPETDPAECPAVTSQEELEARDLSDFSLPASFSTEDGQ